MTIYYLMINAVPGSTNPEIMEFGGAYVNCWVKAATQADAIDRAREYIEQENWIFLKAEEMWVAHRCFYINLPNSLKCFDEACKYGLSAIFNTWPIDENQICSPHKS